MQDIEIKYAKSGNLNIAYQICGLGDEYLIIIPGWVSNIEEIWNLPGLPEFIQPIAALKKVLLFDKRGTGLSDRVNEDELPNLAVRIDDLRSIMDQEKIDRATIMGVSEGGPMALLFSATFPEKVQSLIIIGSYANWLQSAGNPHGIPMQIHEKTMSKIDKYWAKGFGLKGFAPSWYGNTMYENIWASFLRKSASPNTAKALYRMNLMIDVSDILPDIKQPCLIVHRTHDKIIPVELGRDLAEKIPEAKMLELEGSDHFFWIDYNGVLKREIVAFLGHTLSISEPQSAIYTILLVNNTNEPTLSVAIDKYTNIEEHGEYTLLAFRSPVEALKTALQITSPTEQEVRILMHTGVIDIPEKNIAGPAVDILKNANAKITSQGLWVSQTSQQFLKGPQMSWPEVKTIYSVDKAISINWYLYGNTDRTERLSRFQHYQDEKLRLSDIEALLNLKDHIDSHFLENPSLTDLSYFSGLNNFKLKYGFKKLFKISVKKHLKDLRLEFARQLLSETDLPIREVAQTIGYEQPGSFSKAYQDKFGLSPQNEKSTSC